MPKGSERSAVALWQVLRGLTACGCWCYPRLPQLPAFGLHFASLSRIISPPPSFSLRMSESRRRTLFRPCIDLHDGQVKQIVGGTLSDQPSQASLKTNHVSRLTSSYSLIPGLFDSLPSFLGDTSHGAAYFASIYRENGLEGAHVIKLGGGNDQAALEALAAWPGWSFLVGTSATGPSCALLMLSG